MFSTKRLPLWRGLCAVFAAFLFLFTIGIMIAQEQAPYIDQALGTVSSKVVTEKTEGEDLYEYKSDYSTTDELIAADKALGIKIAEEGVVLLKNQTNALPLTGKNVTLMGMAAYSPILGGKMGSGASNNATINPDYAQVTVKAALEEAEIAYNPDFDAAYSVQGTNRDGSKTYRSHANISGSFGMTEVNAAYTVDEVNPAELEDAKSGITTGSLGVYKDVIVVLGRVSSEGRDYVPGTKGITDDGALSPLGLTNDERAIINLAKTQATAGGGKVIVLLNSNSAMEIEELKNDDGIGAILWIGTPGVWGMHGVVNVLTGKTAPSGHLPDTYAVAASNSPAAQNTGVFVWGNKDEISIPAGTYRGVTYTESTGSYSNIRSVAYSVQAESIYIGYKYYESRYYDAVSGGSAVNPIGDKAGAKSTVGAVSGATEWKYEDEVSYSFGEGISYTTFTQKITGFSVDKNAKKATVTVNVKNDGTQAAKDAVQLYVSVPYTQYDKDNKVAKSAIQLLDFGKTGLIAGGSDVDVTLDVDLTYLASYDEENAKTYILDAGDYYFAIGDGAHDAMNNVLAKQGFTTADGMTAAGNGSDDKVRVWNNARFDATTFSTAKNGTKITNQLDDADLNYFKEGEVTYLTRSDWDGTFPKVYNGVTANAQMIEQLRNRTYEVATGESLPDLWGQTYEDKITLGAMKNAEFDDERWYYFLNQITIEEAVDIIAAGGTGTRTLESIQNPYAIQSDGPNGFNSGGRSLGGSYSNTDVESPHFVAENDPNKGYMFGTMPNAPLVASTFDKGIAAEFGKHVGEQSLWIGGPSIWAGGANIHRTPFGGRTHEYYSEDSVLSTYILAEFVKGGLEKGCLIGPKHFAFNDYEYNRYGLAEFMTEQQARENDLRCFQRAFEDEGCLAAMTAFNRIGVSYINGHQGLMQNILRGEWGFKGLLTTDMVNNAYLFMLAETINGGITMMANNSQANVAEGGVWAYSSASAISGDAKLTNQLRMNMKYQWYAYANSNLMNGINETSRVITYMTWWKALLIGGIVGFGVLTLAAAALYAVTALKSKEEN